MTNPSAALPTRARARSRARTCAVRTGAAALSLVLATGVPVAGATPEAADADELLGLANRERAVHALAPLVLDPSLQAGADGHARAMAAGNRLFHTSMTGAAPAGWSRLGENVAMAGSADAAHRALLGSDAHRRNMLDPGFRAVGIGVAHGPDGSRWVSVKLAAGAAGAPGTARSVDAAGVVTVAAGTRHHGDLRRVRLAAPVVGMATTPSGAGYWLVAADGGVFAFGDAPFLGSAATSPLPSPAVRINRTSTGQGYAVFTADGARHGFGDAR